MVNGGHIFTWTRGDARWTEGTITENWLSVASSADGRKLVAGTASGQLYTSTDGGANWIARESARFWSAVASSADGTRLAATDLGSGIYTSTDSGQNWTLSNPLGLTWSAVASSADGITHGLNLDSMKTLVNGLKKLARGAKGSEFMPRDYKSLLQGSFDNFSHMTFKPVRGGLFDLDELVPKTERQQRADEELANKKKELREAKGPLGSAEQSALRKEIDALSTEVLKLTMAREKEIEPDMRALEDNAMPYIIQGIVEAMEWVLENVEALAEAHEMGEPIGRNLDRAGMEEAAKIFSALKPAERDKLLSLKPNPSELVMQTA